MKFLGLTFILLVGCSTTIKDDHIISKKYVGKEGYFSIKPSNLYAFSSDAFKSCEKVKLTKVVLRSIVPGEVPRVFVYLDQGKASFNYEENRALFDQGKLELIDKSFKENLNLSNRMISIKGRGKVPASTLICEGGAFLGMKSDEMLTSMGQPEKINRSGNSRLVTEQWVYGRNYYYFENGVLTSWQNW